MKVIWDYLTVDDRKYLITQVSLVELFQELHRRANQDVEEDEEIYWEDELESIHKERLSHRFPRFTYKRGMGNGACK